MAKKSTKSGSDYKNLIFIGLGLVAMIVMFQFMTLIADGGTTLNHRTEYLEYDYSAVVENDFYLLSQREQLATTGWDANYTSSNDVPFTNNSVIAWDGVVYSTYGLIAENNASSTGYFFGINRTRPNQLDVEVSAGKDEQIPRIIVNFANDSELVLNRTERVNHIEIELDSYVSNTSISTLRVLISFNLTESNGSYLAYNGYTRALLGGSIFNISGVEEADNIHVYTALLDADTIIGGHITAIRFNEVNQTTIPSNYFSTFDTIRQMSYRNKTYQFNHTLEANVVSYNITYTGSGWDRLADMTYFTIGGRIHYNPHLNTFISQDRINFGNETLVDFIAFQPAYNSSHTYTFTLQYAYREPIRNVLDFSEMMLGLMVAMVFIGVALSVMYQALGGKK